MPRETIYGEDLTVRYGDLPVAQAWTRADVAPLATQRPPAPAGYEHLDLLDPTTQLDLCTAIELTWARDGGHVGLLVAGWDANRALRVPLGGAAAGLDWARCNQLIRKLRVARNQAFGTPE